MDIQAHLADLAVFLAIDLLCFALAWSLVRHNGFCRQQVERIDPARASMIDGLRGWLALGVFFTHASAMRAYVGNGQWGGAPPNLFGMAGEVGVSLFFMITGFLFWGRALRAGGHLDVRALYVSRLRRIVPMYLVSVLLVLAVVAVQSDFSLRVGVAELVRELRAWLSFGFIHAGDLNGVRDAHYINAVYWTLAYEWGFYVALPLFALLGGGWRALAFFPVAFLYALQAPVTLNFIFGALAAHLVEAGLVGGRLKPTLLAPLPLAALAGVFLLPSAFSLAGAGLLFLFFLFVVGDNSLFGLLAARASRLLGAISYSIYLTHCIVLYVLVHAVDAYRPVRAMGDAEYWLLAAAAATATVLLSALTYRCVERPFFLAKEKAAPLSARLLTAS